jgi:hypothetical protein
MVMQRDRLVMGINREGFLVAEVWKDGGIALYRVTDTAYWDNYTIGSFFVFQDEPAALLYRNDFFTEPTAPPPAPQVFVQGKGSDRPVGIQIPAFESFPAAAGWEVDALRQGGDRHWYYRSIQRTEPEAQYAYFSVRDLSHAGAVSSVSRFRDSALPLSPDTAPALLRQVLEKAAGLSRVNQAPIAGIISPEYAYPRYFAGENALTMNDLIELSGYYHDNGDTGARALVIYPDGKGFFGESRGGAFNVEALNLPLLPEGFVYTRIGTVSDTIIAAWEEQHDLTVGAAGLMILRGAGTEEK